VQDHRQQAFGLGHVRCPLAVLGDARVVRQRRPEARFRLGEPAVRVMGDAELRGGVAEDERVPPRSASTYTSWTSSRAWFSYSSAASASCSFASA
jgi:hypothetical protein